MALSFQKTGGDRSNKLASFKDGGQTHKRNCGARILCNGCFETLLTVTLKVSKRIELNYKLIMCCCPLNYSLHIFLM